MPVNLSIKNVPDELADALRSRAAKNHRSIQGELMAILQQAVLSGGRLSASEVLARIRGLGLATADGAVEMIRRDRDGW